MKDSWKSRDNIVSTIAYVLIPPPALSFLRSVAEPAVVLRNLPENYTEDALLKLFDLYKPARAELSTVDGVLEGIVVLGGPADVDLASLAMSRWKRVYAVQHCDSLCHT